MYAYSVLAISATLLVSLSSTAPIFPRGNTAKTPEPLNGGEGGALNPVLPIYKDKREEHGLLPGIRPWEYPTTPEAPSPAANNVAAAFKPETPDYKGKRQEKGLLPGFQPAVYPSSPETSNGVGATLQPSVPSYKEKRQENGLLPGFQPWVYPASPDEAPANNGANDALGLSEPSYKEKRQMMEIPPAEDVPTTSGSSVTFSPTPGAIPPADMNVGAALQPDLPIYKE